jgi:hypothetical protein
MKVRIASARTAPSAPPVSVSQLISIDIARHGVEFRVDEGRLWLLAPKAETTVRA